MVARMQPTEERWFNIDGDYRLTLTGTRPSDPYYDPESAEAQLLPYIRVIDWTHHNRELDMIKAQLDLIAKAQRGELD